MSSKCATATCRMDRRSFLGTTMLGGAMLFTAPFFFGRTAQAAETVVLPPLPYGENALEPYISARTISFHYGKHHAGYVKKTNTLLEGSGLEGESLDKIVVAASENPELTNLFNNAAQVWNHNFYWLSMKPGGGGQPQGLLLDKVVEDFGSADAMYTDLAAKAGGQFGSGWAWLVLEHGKLSCVNTPNANTPLAMGMTSLLCIDVWEHAYYLDYQNRRGDYVQGIIEHLIDWEFAAENLRKSA